jgi:hypothetical protein
MSASERLLPVREHLQEAVALKPLRSKPLAFPACSSKDVQFFSRPLEPLVALQHSYVITVKLKPHGGCRADAGQMPGKHRINGEQAMLFIGGIRDRLSITLSGNVCPDALQS